MTTQTIIAKSYSGLTLDATIHNRISDADLAPSHTIVVTELTAGGGIYSIVFTGIAVVAAVAGRLKLFAAGELVDNDQLFRFAGTDGETVETVAVVLDAATQTQIDDILLDTGTTLPAQIAGISGVGTGARTVTITVNDGMTALQNATVRMTEGVNTFTASTNVSGVAVFNLDDATYTVAVTKAGYTYAGTTLMVDGTEAATYSMTVVVVAAPASPSKTAIEVLCLDADDDPVSGIDIDLRRVVIPTSGTNTAYLGTKVTVTSDVNGIARFEVAQGITVEYKRGEADVWHRLTVDSDSVTNVTSFIGSP